MNEMRKLVQQFCKYFSVGILGFLAEYALFNLLLWACRGLPLAPSLENGAAHTVSVLAGAVLCFFLNKFWSFSRGEMSQKGTKIQGLRYAALFVCNLFLSNGLLWLGTPLVGVQLAKMGAMALLVPWNFCMYKFFVYR